MKTESIHAVQDRNECARQSELADHYMAQERKHLEMVACWWFCVKLTIIGICLWSIWGHLQELWIALTL